MLTHNKCIILLIIGDVQEHAKKMRALRIKVSEQAIYSAIASAIVKYRANVIWRDNEVDAFKIMIPMFERFERGESMTPNNLSHPVIISKLFGINKHTAMDMISKFGTIESMIYASEKELVSIKGIGKVKAKHIKSVLTENLNGKA